MFFQDDPRAPFTGLLRRLVREWNEDWPKAKLLRSDCTRAKVQLAMGVWMALEGLGTAFQADFEAYVAVVSDTTRQVEWVEVSEQFLYQVGRPLYLDLKQCITKWRQEEQEEKKRKQEEKQQQPSGHNNNNRNQKRQRDDDAENDDDSVSIPNKRPRYE